MRITLDTTQLIAFLNHVIRATDHAETRLGLIDTINSPAIPSNTDVIETVKSANGEARRLREALDLLGKDPEFVNLVKRAQQIPALLGAMGIKQ